MIGEKIDSIIDRCEKHSLLAGNNHLPLLSKFYKGQRPVLVSFIENIQLVSTTQERSVLRAAEFILEHRTSREEWIKAPGELDMSFVSDNWFRLVTGKKNPRALFDKLHRRNFELCVFDAIMNELKSGDLCIPQSDKFRDYRDQLISWEDYESGIQAYAQQSGVEIRAPFFVSSLKNDLQREATKADRGFATNSYLTLENGEPVLKRLTASAIPDGFEEFEHTLRTYMKENDVLNILWQTEQAERRKSV